MSGSDSLGGRVRLAEGAILREPRAARKRPRAVAAGDVHEGRAAGVRRFGLVPLRLVTSTLPLGAPACLRSRMTVFFVMLKRAQISRTGTPVA